MKRRKKKNAHKKRASNPRRKRARSNPRRKRAHTKHRRRTSNPRPRRSNARRARRSNPTRRHHPRKHRRRNPMNPYLAAGGAFLVSLVVGAIEVFVPVLVAPKIPAGQPNAGTTDTKTMGYIQTGLSVLGIGGGIFLAKKHPMLAVAIGAPSVAGLLGTMLSAVIAKALVPATTTATTTTATTTPAAPAATTTKGLGALQRQLGALLSAQGNPHLSGFANAQGAPRLNAVFAQDMGAVYAQNMGAVYAQSMGAYGYDGEDDYMGMGEAAGDSAPWSQGTPFG